MAKLKIVHVASEVAPLAKSGGLADVVGMLARAHEKLGHRLSIFMPYYRGVRKLTGLDVRPVLSNLPVHVAPGIKEEVSILQAQLPNSKVNVFLVDNAKAFDRDQLYGTPDGDYPDNAERFILFSRAVLQSLKEMNESYDILHCHDWQTALIPAYLKILYAGEPVFGRMATVFSIHNLASQGLFPKETVVKTGLGWSMFTPDQLEFYGKVSFMKAGILYADKIATVSPTYAREILTPEGGCGLEGLLKTRKRDLIGLLNGMDQDDWDPEKDALIAATYSRRDISGKAACKTALLSEMGLTPPAKSRSMLIGVVGRLVEQKGIDLIAAAAAKLTKRPIQLVMLGIGNQTIRDLLIDMTRKYPDQVVLWDKFDNALAHRIYAGADAFLMPSRFEPCGLGQMIALRYGTLPIVCETGGLADTIRPVDGKKKHGTGFLFKPATIDAMLKAIDEAIAVYNDEPAWKTIVHDAMAKDFSWTVSAKKYEAFYVQSREKRAK